MFDSLTIGPGFRFVRKRSLDSESETIAKRTLRMAAELFAKAVARHRRKKRDNLSDVAQLTAQLQAAEQRAFLAERTS
ncbi:MAG: hypothetical protein ABI672_13385 [Vicinamibacteria bacterium]